MSYDHLDNWQNRVHDLAAYLAGKIREALGAEELDRSESGRFGGAPGCQRTADRKESGLRTDLSPPYVVCDSCRREGIQSCVSVAATGDSYG